jgi:hypothetical protein
MKTDALIITGEELPATGRLLALDLIKRADTEHPNKQLMVVRVSDNSNLPLHKVGMTYPVQFHEKDGTFKDCCCGHVHSEDLQRYSIGGMSCEYCSQRRNASTTGV